MKKKYIKKVDRRDQLRFMMNVLGCINIIFLLGSFKVTWAHLKDESINIMITLPLEPQKAIKSKEIH